LVPQSLVRLCEGHRLLSQRVEQCQRNDFSGGLCEGPRDKSHVQRSVCGRNRSEREPTRAAVEAVFTKERLREEWRCASIVYGGRPGRHTPRGARLSQQHFWFNVCDFIRLSMSLLVQRALISTCARQEQAARNLHEAKCNEIAGNEEECAHFALLPGGLHVPLG